MSVTVSRSTRTSSRSSASPAPAASPAPRPASRPGPASSKDKENSSNPDPCPLFMDCCDEPLSEFQLQAQTKQHSLFQEQMKKLEQMAKAAAKVTYHENGSVSFRVTDSTTTTTTTTSTASGLTPINSAPVPVSVMNAIHNQQPQHQPQQQQQQHQNYQMGMPQNPGQPAPYRLLMGPRTGRILGTINNPPNAQPIRMGQPSMLRPVRPPPQIMRHLTPVPAPMRPMQIQNARSIAPTATSHPPPAPAQVVSNPSIVDLARTANSPINEKTKNFPCLNVQPKVQKTIQNLAVRRSELDGKVKQLLVLSPQKFTEWLMQQSLILQQQYENVGGKKFKLKLGLYQQDTRRYPHSGGYVWISEKASNRMTSVYKGSIFEIGVHPPSVVLKLIYHWACQTNINNVVQWVKVDNNVINTFYQVFRSVCLASVQDEIVKMGGPNKIIEIGVISLGTTSADGNKREVRVEVLGVLERATGNFRLRATEPRKNITQSERFQLIFQQLSIWVHKSSRIITDNSIDREKLRQLGYNNVIQTTVSSKSTFGSNNQIMEYLKKVVPKMFHNSLSSLTTAQIQQFLDELTFREICGNFPLLSFDSLIERIATQTRAAFERNMLMSVRVKKIGENPFADWRISNLNQPMAAAAASPRASPAPPKQSEPGFGFGIDALPPSLRSVDPPSQAQNRAPITPMIMAPNLKRVPDHEIDQVITKKMRASNEFVKLETYYYATMQGEIQILAGEFKADMAFKCHLCKKLFMNNIEFMKHLSLHVENERATAVDLSDLCQCKYCFKDFESLLAMQTHVDEVHKKKGFNFVCRICEEGFVSVNLLIHHMTTMHVKYEMPFLCQVCGFRSSFHKDIVDHFQEVHDRTDKLQCPRCLKIFVLCGDKGYNSTMAISFVDHVQAHQDKSVKCKKCCLTFLNDKEVKFHSDKDHLSFKGNSNAEEHTPAWNEDPTRMPKPDERRLILAPKKLSFVKAQQQSAFAAQNLEDLLMYDVENEDCGECKKKFVMKSHFAAYLCCTKCRYSTCCSKAMSLHVNIFHHGPGKPVFDLGTPFFTPEDMHCVCGFKTMSGNKMAKHLGKTRCLSAYPSAEAAKKALVELPSASFAPLISLGGQEDEIESFDPNEVMAKAYHQKTKDDESEANNKQPQLGQSSGPLAFLGLTRKPDEENSKEAEKKEAEKSEANKNENSDGNSKNYNDKEKSKGTKDSEMKSSKDDKTEKENENVSRDEEMTDASDEKVESKENEQTTEDSGETGKVDKKTGEELEETTKESEPQEDAGEEEDAFKDTEQDEDSFPNVEKLSEDVVMDDESKGNEGEEELMEVDKELESETVKKNQEGTEEEKEIEEDATDTHKEIEKELTETNKEIEKELTDTNKEIEKQSIEVETDSAKTGKEYSNVEAESTEAEKEPTEAEMESTEAEKEPTESKMESTEAEKEKEPTEVEMESTEAEKEPIEAEKEPIEAEKESAEKESVEKESTENDTKSALTEKGSLHSEQATQENVEENSEVETAISDAMELLEGGDL